MRKKLPLSESLRQMVLSTGATARVARESGVPQATLHEFVSGRSDGTYPDIRLGVAQKLLNYFHAKGTGQRLSGFKARTKGLTMTLKKELIAHGCPDSAEKFRDRLVDTLRNRFSGYTIDMLLCRPEKAAEFAADVISETDGKLDEFFVLHQLLNLRKRKDCPTELKGSRKRQTLVAALAEYDIDVDAEEFRDIIANSFLAIHRDLPPDRLLCLPTEAKAYCQHLRSTFQDIPDELILRTLLNIRKKG